MPRLRAVDGRGDSSVRQAYFCGNPPAPGEEEKEGTPKAPSAGRPRIEEAMSPISICDSCLRATQDLTSEQWLGAVALVGALGASIGAFIGRRPRDITAQYEELLQERAELRRELDAYRGKLARTVTRT